MKRELNIVPPEGYEIDRENSTFECIKFKPVTKRWRDKKSVTIRGFYIHNDATICDYKGENESCNYNVFATEKHAKSALAMAQISQIIANDERFGGVVTDEEFKDENKWTYSINRNGNKISMYQGYFGVDHFLSFHTQEQRDLFLKENEDLVKDYLMID